MNTATVKSSAKMFLSSTARMRLRGDIEAIKCRIGFPNCRQVSQKCLSTPTVTSDTCWSDFGTAFQGFLSSHVI